MPSCVLRYCKINSMNKVAGISFFRFPNIHRPEREAWIKFVQQERREPEWFPSTFSVICSKHFRSEDLEVGKTGRKHPKKNTIPIAEEDEPNTGYVSSISVSVSDEEIDEISKTPKERRMRAMIERLQLVSDRRLSAARGRPIMVEWERETQAFGGPLSRSIRTKARCRPNRHSLYLRSAVLEESRRRRSERRDPLARPTCVIILASGPDLPNSFLGFSPGPRGFKGPPAKSKSKIDDMRKNRGAPETYEEQTEKNNSLPGLAILAPSRVYALTLGTGGTALFTALSTSRQSDDLSSHEMEYATLSP
ncbi:hypothetical protein EVAR_63827_1 [Eumeta japonica]|uniref:THAP-type domain-containing protein n=1 Tax=Eumeta variegata TaxID=151549 RepID=A0A4C1ZJG6_EUMVA|nr:hypothetical protein EVAR_63827_1 [Eumeta japonica]